MSIPVEPRGLRQAPRPLARVIFATLDEAKASTVTHARGGNGMVFAAPCAKEAQLLAAAGWEPLGNGIWRLPADVYDLSISARYLAREHGSIGRDGRIRRSFQASFSKAARLLCESSVLVCDDPALPQFRAHRFVRRKESMLLVTDERREAVPAGSYLARCVKSESIDRLTEQHGGEIEEMRAKDYEFIELGDDLTEAEHKAQQLASERHAPVSLFCTSDSADGWPYEYLHDVEPDPESTPAP